MRIVLTLALFALTACQSAGAQQPANLEQLVKVCQQKTGQNFTYGPETATLLHERQFRMGSGEPVTPEAWMDLLRTTLGAQGLELERIGPERITVWLVTPRHKGA